MSGGRRNDEKDGKKEEESGGWASTFLKVAGAAAATAAVAGGLYSLLKQPEAAAPFGVKQTHLEEEEEEEEDEEEEVILYVDGSHFPQTPSAGCGGFLCDTSGKWICGFALKLDSNLKLDEIEKEAILSGLRWVNRKGKKKVTVKSDREEAIKSVKSERRSNDARICEIRNLLNSPHWKATLTWIPGDDNKLADKLADEAHKLDHDQYEEFHDPPKMSGAGRRNDEKDTKEGEGAGGGWASTFFKVAGAVAATAAAAVAVAAVASSSQNVLKQPDATGGAPFQARRPDYLEEVVILYVDGSLLREHEVPSAACGGFLSDSSGKWLCGFAQKLNPNLKVDETEKEAILRGLLWVKEKGKKKVVVKSDNEGVVYSVNCGGRSNDPLVCGIRDLLNSPRWEATLTCIRGRTNAVADRLAHKAHSFTSFDLREFDYPPENCTSLLI